MRLCLDHSVHGALARALSTLGIDIRSARELGPGVADIEVLRFATADSRVLVAQDTDFGELIFRDGQACVGVISIRFEIRDEAHANETARRIAALGGDAAGAS